MICSKCGAENDSSAEKCRQCAWSLKSRLVVDEQICANHPRRMAVSTCHSCGLELCEECEVFIGDVSYCRECAERPGEEELLRDVPVVDPAQAEPAGFWIRTLAGAVDLIILGCAFSVLWTAFWLLFGDPTVPLRLGDHPWAHVLFWVIVGVTIPVYYIYSIATNSQTPGMSAFDIAVVRSGGEAADYRTAILRYMAVFPAIVSIFGIFWCIWDKNGRMLHDRLTKTSVVRM
ncbi:MAG: RDD family protein [Armatimonadota bacterium]